VIFLKSAPRASNETFEACKSFLSDMIKTESDNSGLKNHSILSIKNNFFASLFLNAHKALIGILKGESRQTHEFRHDGTQLLKFLVLCGHRNTPDAFYKNSPCDLALMCFTIEALLHCGWCPDSFEGVSKRAAHEYFVCLKKELHHVNINEGATILGYLWCAWLMAQKTEGIRDNGETVLPEISTFEWGSGATRRRYIVKKSPKSPYFYILPKHAGARAHPFSSLYQDGTFGLFLTINTIALVPGELTDYAEILRPKIHGHKFTHQCKFAGRGEIAWTVALMNFESTTYRIDLLKLLPIEKVHPMEKLVLQAKFVFENNQALKEIAPNQFVGKGFENTILKFIETPFELSFSKQYEHGISVFESPQKNFSFETPLIMTTAWAYGKGITDINHTHLLGIFD
jgi:hypothetical protein